MKEEKSLSELDEIVKLSYLYDFYGALLKENHRQIFEDYVLNDLSLSEIAEEHGITRQGVYDVVKRCRTKLKDYEQRLHLVHKFEIMKEKLQKIEKIAAETSEQNSDGIPKSVSEEIKRLKTYTILFSKKRN